MVQIFESLCTKLEGQLRLFQNFYLHVVCFQNKITDLSLEMFNITLAKSIVALTTCLVTVYPFIGFAHHLIMHDMKFYKMLNKSLVGKVTETRKVKDCFDCCFLCLEHGPSVCLSFNFGKASDNENYTCELSNSERYLEPERLEQRSSYDYYGTATEVSFKNSLALWVNSKQRERIYSSSVSRIVSQFNGNYLYRLTGRNI